MRGGERSVVKERRRDVAFGVPKGGEGKGKGVAGRRGFVDRIRESTISYFFTNLPEDANRSQIWKSFSSAGEVADVFIPSKVDKWGRRFGFVRFKDERDVSRLERRLGDIWMGSFKLQINRPHSSSSASPINRKRQNDLKPELQEVKETPTVAMARPKWGDVDGGKNVPPWGKSNSSFKHPFNIEYRPSEERLKTLSTCYVGLLAESQSATVMEFQHSLFLEGYHAIKATDMGGFNSPFKHCGWSNTRCHQF